MGPFKIIRGTVLLCESFIGEDSDVNKLVISVEDNEPVYAEWPVSLPIPESGEYYRFLVEELDNGWNFLLGYHGE